MTAETPDYGAFADTAPTAEKLDSLSDLVRQMADAERKMKEAEEEHKRAREFFETFAHDKIPTLLRECGLSDGTYTFGGWKVTLKPQIRMSQKRATGSKPDQIAWLDENGYGGCVKREVAVAFTKEEQEKARHLLKMLARRYGSVKLVNDYAANTVKASMGETLEAIERGDEDAPVAFPMELFGAERFDRVTIKPAEGK